MDHKFQLTAHALFVEEIFDIHVACDFINCIPEDVILELEMTPTMKVHVKRVIENMASDLTSQKRDATSSARRLRTQINMPTVLRMRFIGERVW